MAQPGHGKKGDSGDFAGLVAERFADRVDGWITINEPAAMTLNGYALGIHAPGEAHLFGSFQRYTTSCWATG